MSKVIENKIVFKSNTKGAKNAKKALQELEKAAEKSKISVKDVLTTISSIGAAIKKATDQTDKLTTAQRILNTTFGKSATGINDYVEGLNKMTGISETGIYNQIALFGQTATSLGLASEEALKYSKNLTTLSSKMAMLYNIDFDSAAKSLRDAAKGESSTLTTLTGIVVKNQSLQNTLYELGVNKQAESLNAAEMAITQYITVAKQMLNADNELSSAVNSVAWQKQMLAQQVQRLGNAFGQVLYPILEKVLPILNAILIVMTNIISTIAKLIGYSGETSKSIDNNTNSMNNFASSIEGAANSAKRSLRSFDKLNNITTPSSGGSAGGGLEIDPNIKSAFEKMNEELLHIKNRATKISEEIMKWLGFSKDVNGEWDWSATTLLKNIYDWWAKLNGLGKFFVGLGLAAIISKTYINLRKLIGLIKSSKITSIISLIAGDIKSLGLKGFVSEIYNLYPALSKIAGIAIGVTDVAMGFTNIKTAIQSLAEEGPNIENITRLLLGLLEVASGIALIVGVFTGNAIAIIAGVAGTLVGVIGEIGLSYENNGKKVDEATQKIEEYNKQIEQGLEIAKKSTEQIDAQAGRAKDLTDQIKKLYDANGKLIGSQEDVAEKVHALNELLGTNYEVTKNGTLAIDDRIISVDELIGEVQKYCEQLRIQAQLEAYYDVYVTRAKKKIELEQKVKEKTEELTRAQENYDLTTEEGINKFLEDNQEKIQSLSALQAQLKTNSKELENYEKASYNASIGNYAEAEKLLTQIVENVGLNIEETVTDIIKQSDKIPKEIKDDIGKVNGISATIKIKIDKTAWDKFQKENSSKLFENMIISGGTGNYQFAEGGFPTQGELFVAREAGPELVGTMNGRTAVANNDQIVKGIEQASYQGMMKALNSAGGKNVTVNINAEGDASGLLNFINFKQNQEARRNGM